MFICVCVYYIYIYIFILEIGRPCKGSNWVHSMATQPKVFGNSLQCQKWHIYSLDEIPNKYAGCMGLHGVITDKN